MGHKEHPDFISGTSVATYSFNGMDLRVVEIDGEPWFVAKDAGMVLVNSEAVRLRGVTQYLTHLDASEKQTKTAAELRSLGLPKGSTGNRAMVLISESGLYKLVMRSDKKEAKQFQDWVTREVLPSIRKTGTYTMPGARKHKMLWFGELRGE
ncbi:Bro-N domain-containing protein [Pseudophaeobacter sp. TrK17]|uniref:BRO-N domain-containing protein n=1 Tax=Pseudophaeobacter sp. TrK17 TaxID=2815167 RepID=UPI0035D026BC